MCHRICVCTQAHMQTQACTAAASHASSVCIQPSFFLLPPPSLLQPTACLKQDIVGDNQEMDVLSLLSTSIQFFKLDFLHTASPFCLCIRFHSSPWLSLRFHCFTSYTLCVKEREKPVRLLQILPRSSLHKSLFFVCVCMCESSRQLMCKISSPTFMPGLFRACFSGCSPRSSFPVPSLLLLLLQRHQ